MEIVDANVVLRYLLKDHESFFPRAKKIIEKKGIKYSYRSSCRDRIRLEKVYEVPRTKISESLSELFGYPNINNSELQVINESLDVYKTENIDFVDALLVSYNRVNNCVIYSFDKKVRKLCKSD